MSIYITISFFCYLRMFILIIDNESHCGVWLFDLFDVEKIHTQANGEGGGYIYLGEWKGVCLLKITLSVCHYGCSLGYAYLEIQSILTTFRTDSILVKVGRHSYCISSPDLLVYLYLVTFKELKKVNFRLWKLSSYWAEVSLTAVWSDFFSLNGGWRGRLSILDS